MSNVLVMFLQGKCGLRSNEIAWILFKTEEYVYRRHPHMSEPSFFSGFCVSSRTVLWQHGYSFHRKKPRRHVEKKETVMSDGQERPPFESGCLQIMCKKTFQAVRIDARTLCTIWQTYACWPQQIFFVEFPKKTLREYFDVVLFVKAMSKST